ncbi:MAG: Ig-like domain-containing protein, partial [Planctomycetota bacterium]
MTTAPSPIRRTQVIPPGPTASPIPSLVFNDDGTFTYTPDAGNTTGADSFTYTVSDEYGGTSGTATVAITLTNQAPIAQPDGYATDQDTPLVVT